MTIRRLVTSVFLAVALIGWQAGVRAQDRLGHSVDQLRHAVGEWSVVTEFLNADGTVARAVKGSYTFEWVVPDRVVRGLSEIPELKQRSAILFYVSESRKVIEMVSVGADGQLFTMTGPLGDEVRHSQVFKAPDGTDMQLRFTRYGVTANRFESRMERTTDGGKTWARGNRQVFERRSGA